MKTKIIITIICLMASAAVSAQENILEQNRELLKNLSKFDRVDEINSQYIKFYYTEHKINFGFGVAFRKNGKIIYPAEQNTAYKIHAYGEYITLCKGKTLGHLGCGMIDSTGTVVLDFIYDQIGRQYPPLPDTMIIVCLDRKFGIFNTNTKTLSDIKYDVGGIYDGYDYLEGGAWGIKEDFYSQLGIERYISHYPHYQFPEKYKVFIKYPDNYSDPRYLVSVATGERISNNYDYLQRTANPLYFEGQRNDIHFLIDEQGKEITEVSYPLYIKNESYIQLDRLTGTNPDIYIRYFFTENRKIIKVPETYEVFVDCYANIGILGFRNLKTGKKLFVDKYGNELFEEELKQ